MTLDRPKPDEKKGISSLPAPVPPKLQDNCDDRPDSFENRSSEKKGKGKTVQRARSPETQSSSDSVTRVTQVPQRETQSLRNRMGPSDLRTRGTGHRRHPSEFRLSVPRGSLKHSDGPSTTRGPAGTTSRITLCTRRFGHSGSKRNTRGPFLLGRGTSGVRVTKYI